MRTIFSVILNAGGLAQLGGTLKPNLTPDDIRKKLFISSAQWLKFDDEFVEGPMAFKVDALVGYAFTSVPDLSTMINESEKQPPDIFKH